MEKKSLQTLISRFFKNDQSGEVRDRFGAWLIRPEQTEEKEEILEKIWNDLPLTTDFDAFAELKKVNRRIGKPAKRLYQRVATVAAVILLPLLGAVTTLWYSQAYKSAEASLVECFVPNGERRQLTLPDGSTVWLNAGSILLYPEAFGTTRVLYLSGEGNFTVVKDEKKPFIVKTNYLDVEALGTVFNVHSYPDDSKTTTILESGKVKVNDKSGAAGDVILSPNEQLVYNHADASFTRSNVDASHMHTWTDGYLIFQKETLGDIFRSLERRYNVKINYNDSKFASMTFTVRFHANDTLEEALDVLKQIGVNYKYKIVNNDVYIQ